MESHLIDLYHLECLQMLVAERHVTRAADRLGLTQAKLSSILARLRVLTGDPLLVRTSEGMTPTSCALELADHAKDMLNRINGTLSRYASFNPATTERTFVIQATDGLIATVIVPLIAHLRVNAPHIRIVVGQPQLTQLREVLERGEADLVISYVDSPPDTLMISHLFGLEFCCIAARDHPTIRGSITMEQYLAAEHVTLSLGRPTTPYYSERAFDDFLNAKGQRRIKAIEVPAALVVPDIVAKTDLIATVAVNILRKSPRRPQLHEMPLPFAGPELSISMVWHRRSQDDAAHQWLRGIIKSMSQPNAGRRRAP